MKPEYNENNIALLFEQKKEKICQLNSQYPLAPQPKENENAPEAAVATTTTHFVPLPPTTHACT